MNAVLIIFFLFTAARCAPDFNERPRNASIELLYFTQLETDGHVAISPLGVWTLMTGVTLGATKKSRTQLARAFWLPKDTTAIVDGFIKLTKAVLNPNTKGVTMTSKNFIFLDNPYNVKPEFRKTICIDFGAVIQTLDFTDSQSAALIANSIIQDSGASVSNVLRADDFTNSRMILTNVICFKGLWTTPFNYTATTIESFYDENTNEIGKVNMMFLSAPVPFLDIIEMNAFILELPYGNDDKYCMLIILPYPKVKVSDVYKKLATTSFPTIFKKLHDEFHNYGLMNVNVKLPRFKISTNVVLNRPLHYMGVFDIFDPALASLEGVTNEQIFVSAIVHKADIEVSESGTVASASSSAQFSDRILTPDFYANRPFLYFVMEKPTVTVIFSGIYSKPSVF